eukprot:1195146-Prorocentrum_minimum.AAC.1
MMTWLGQVAGVDAALLQRHHPLEGVARLLAVVEPVLAAVHPVHLPVQVVLVALAYDHHAVALVRHGDGHADCVEPLLHDVPPHLVLILEHLGRSKGEQQQPQRRSYTPILVYTHALRLAGVVAALRCAHLVHLVPVPRVAGVPHVLQPVEVALRVGVVQLHGEPRHDVRADLLQALRARVVVHHEADVRQLVRHPAHHRALAAVAVPPRPKHQDDALRPDLPRRQQHPLHRVRRVCVVRDHLRVRVRFRLDRQSGRKWGTGHRVEKRGRGAVGVECALAVIGTGGPVKGNSGWYREGLALVDHLEAPRHRLAWRLGLVPRRVGPRRSSRSAPAPPRISLLVETRVGTAKGWPSSIISKRPGTASQFSMPSAMVSRGTPSATPTAHAASMLDTLKRPSRPLTMLMSPSGHFTSTAVSNRDSSTCGRAGGPKGREVGEREELDESGEKRGRVSGVLSVSLPLLAQEDP